MKGQGRGIVALHPGQDARPIERPGSLQTSLLISRLFQCPPTPLPALREMAPSPPVTLQRPTKTQPRFGRRNAIGLILPPSAFILACEAPLQGRPQVLMLRFQAPQPPCLLRTSQFRFCLLRKRQEAVPMPTAPSIGLTSLCQLLFGIPAYRLQKEITGLSLSLFIDQQALVGQGEQQVQHLPIFHPLAKTDLFRCL